jgi:hypothetical protein
MKRVAMPSIQKLIAVRWRIARISHLPSDFGFDA